MGGIWMRSEWGQMGILPPCGNASACERIGMGWSLVALCIYSLVACHTRIRRSELTCSCLNESCNEGRAQDCAMLHADCTTVSRGGAPEPGDSASYIDVNISLSAPATYEPNLAASAPARSTDHRRSWVTADPDRNGRVGVVRGRYDVCVAWATREFEDRPRRLARCLFSRDTTAAHRSPPSTIRTMNHAACSSITNSNTHDSLGEPSAIQHPAHPRGKA